MGYQPSTTVWTSGKQQPDLFQRSLLIIAIVIPKCYLLKRGKTMESNFFQSGSDTDNRTPKCDLRCIVDQQRAFSYILWTPPGSISMTLNKIFLELQRFYLNKSEIVINSEKKPLLMLSYPISKWALATPFAIHNYKGGVICEIFIYDIYVTSEKKMKTKFTHYMKNSIHI